MHPKCFPPKGRQGIDLLYRVAVPPLSTFRTGPRPCASPTLHADLLSTISQTNMVIGHVFQPSGAGLRKKMLFRETIALLHAEATEELKSNRLKTGYHSV